MTNIQSIENGENPLWLLEPPDADDIAPPVDTLAQLLPFGEITWQNFERLSLKLATIDGEAEYWRLYGRPGDEQGGIDIYVRRRSTTKYATWQSKRHKSFTPSQVELAVAGFLASKWAQKSDRFVLCVQASLRASEIADRIEECAQGLREKGVEFEALDGEQLSQKLKSLPEIVYDFFGLAWVERFCGREAALSLSNRLRPSDFRRLRSGLLACYRSHFASVDPGVLGQIAAPAGSKRHLQLPERFVEPNLFEEAGFIVNEPPPSREQSKPQVDPALGEDASPTPIVSTPRQLRQERMHLPLHNWVLHASHDVVLGLAGAGKSTLLRFIAIDMLSENPRLVGLRRRFPDFVPVWVSFAFWTKLIAADRGRASLIDAIEAWFRRQDEPDLQPLVRKAFDDNRLLLLVDGIDEWDNETAASTAITLLQGFAERRSIPVIVTSRPHGFRLVTAFDGSWRISEIAPFTADQQIELAATWFAHLSPVNEDTERRASKSRQQATAFIAEVQRNGPMAQLAATPLLLTGLIALKFANLQLPRNRFLAYAALTKLLLETHPTARDKAALAGAPRHSLDHSAREIALASLAYAIQSGQESTSPDSTEIDRAVRVLCQCLKERIGMSQAEAIQNARLILSFGEEQIGILVKKSPKEVGFFIGFFRITFHPATSLAWTSIGNSNLFAFMPLMRDGPKRFFVCYTSYLDPAKLTACLP